MTWFLDTNTIIFCLRAKSPAAMRRLHAVPAAEVRVPLQVHAELFVGAAKSKDPANAKARVLAFIAPFAVAWPDANVEEHRLGSNWSLSSLERDQ